MERKIVDVKSPILRQVSKTVKKIDKKTQDLIADMRDTLIAQKDPEGVGLAAPQIGKNLRIFLINYNGAEHCFPDVAVVRYFRAATPRCAHFAACSHQSAMAHLGLPKTKTR